MQAVGIEDGVSLLGMTFDAFPQMVNPLSSSFFIVVVIKHMRGLPTHVEGAWSMTD